MTCSVNVKSRFGDSMIPCSNRVTVTRGKAAFCAEHDPGEYIPKPRKKIENKWSVGQWVRLYDGRCGQITWLAPPGKPGVRVQVSKGGAFVNPCKSAICDLANPGSYNDAAIPHLRHRSGGGTNDDGRHPADYEDA